MKNTIFSEPTIQSSKQREMKREEKKPISTHIHKKGQRKSTQVLETIVVMEREREREREFQF
jgi:hypothetical protein